MVSSQQLGVSSPPRWTTIDGCGYGWLGGGWGLGIRSWPQASCFGPSCIDLYGIDGTGSAIDLNPEAPSSFYI